MHLRRPLMIVAAIGLLAAVPLWLRYAVPWCERLPAHFHYQADIASRDNFYDESAGKYSGEKRSVTKFSYDAAREKDGILTVRNVFDVRRLTGENIFTVERLYGVDAKTGKHVAGFGDRDREGYLFAPRHLQKGEPFTYWHINYDGPAHMRYVDEHVIDGVTVYRYETRYEGVRIDQTSNLLSLPGVGTTRGVELEPYLQVWIEPVSGHLVKYQDDTVAYFYDLRTGKRLSPWNHFGNTYTSESVTEHIQEAKTEKFTDTLLSFAVPALFVLCATMLLLFACSSKKTIRLLFLGCIAVSIIVGIKIWMNARTLALPPYSGPVETIRLGAEEGLLASSVWVAQHNGYFEDHGLHVEVKGFLSGRAAITSLFKDGNLDMVTVAQTPVTTNSFVRNDYAIVAGMVTSGNDVKILARKDRGIRTGADLKGKHIGVTQGSTGHFFLSLFLAQYNLKLTDVTTVDLEASALPQAIIDGNVDAISSWEPYIYTAEKKLGPLGLPLESRGTFREDFYFVVFKDWARKHAEALQRFIAAIDEADAFIAAHPEESQHIVANTLQLDAGFVASVWKEYAFRLFLDQAILLTLEQQSRWLLANDLTKGAAPVNYLDFIYFDALEAAKPDAVTAIH